MDSPTLSSSVVKAVAATVGFDACGLAEATALTPEEFHLDEWIAHGFHADMHYMEQYRDLRTDPRVLHPGARTVISVLLGYKPSRRMEGPARIAQYAYGEDYHQRVKRMLYQLISSLRTHYPDFEARPCVDTAPISDKLWAARAGLGWIGRNTLLINPTLGSYCFIGELVTTSPADLYDKPIENLCGNCHACVDACPNKALTHSSINELTHSIIPLLNARRCASYHTIENRAETLPPEIHLSGYAFGCDCCQLVCPYNQAAPARFTLTDERKAQLEALADADPATFKHFAKHSALNRIRHSQWLRNQKQR